MTVIELILKELQEEAQTTRKMLSRVPFDKFDWKPHSKSMSVKTLATHIAELPGWIPMALNTDELDFEAAPYTPTLVSSTNDLLELHEKSLASAIAGMQATNEQILDQPWILRMGTTILAKTTKLETIRMSQAQIIHHRAQLGVYLRLLDIPIPGSYGPSADESF
ncbi:MAG TPA: DinB family protein [Flavitalea sp.]|nr:DinB family protein [Flavitalea sp.]